MNMIDIKRLRTRTRTSTRTIRDERLALDNSDQTRAKNFARAKNFFARAKFFFCEIILEGYIFDIYITFR